MTSPWRSGICHQLLEKTAQQEKKELLFILNSMKKEWTRNFEICLLYEAWLSGQDPGSDLDSYPLIDVFPIETLYTRLVSYPWAALSEENISAFAGMLMNFRHAALLLDRQLVLVETRGQADDSSLGLIRDLSATVKGHKEGLDTCWEEIVSGIKAIKVIASTKTPAP
jgi:hypothetical protein